MKLEKTRPALCTHCHRELKTEEVLGAAEKLAAGERVYCAACQPIANVQATWRPLVSGTVQAIYRLDNKKL